MGSLYEIYQKNGYIKSNFYNLLPEKLIKSIEEYFKNNFLQFNQKLNFNDLKSNFGDKYFLKNGIKYTGYSDDQIFFRSQNHLFKGMHNKNILFGKFAFQNLKNIDNDITKIINNKHLNSFIQNNICRDEFVFLDGFLNVYYPGYLGINKKFHNNLYEFTSNKKLLNFFDANVKKFSLTLFFDDSTIENGYFRVLPKSHNEFLENSLLIAKSLKKKKKFSLIEQTNGFYDELIPNLSNKVKHVFSQRGMMLIMDSFLLHSQTNNSTTNKVLKTITLHYASKSNVLKKNNLDLKTLPISKVIKNVDFISYKIDGESKLMNFIDNIKIYLNNNRNRINLPKRILKKIYNSFYNLNINKNSVSCLNIGSGSGWVHPKYFTIDSKKGVDPRRSIIQDLTINKKLPFDNNSLNAIYSSHCFEHFIEQDAIFTLKECYRILKPNGCIRIIVPDINKFFDSYKDRDLKFMRFLKDRDHYKKDSWLRLIVRQISEPIVRNFTDEDLYRIFNDKKNIEEFCNHFLKIQEREFKNKNLKINFFPDNHKNYFTFNKLKSYLNKVGFKNVLKKERNKTDYNFFKNGIILNDYFDTTQPKLSLYVECKK